MVAERNVSWWLGATSIAASWIWAPALFVSVQVAYEKGLPGIFWFTFPNIIALLLFIFLAPKIREKLPYGYTLPQWIRYKLKIRQFLREIAKIIEINKETVTLCRDNNRNIPDGIVYSIVLRLRELYLIKCLFSNKNYSKRNFLEVCGEEAYSAYIRIKRDERELNNVSYDKAIKLIELSEKWLRELKS